MFILSSKLIKKAEIQYELSALFLRFDNFLKVVKSLKHRRKKIIKTKAHFEGRGLVFYETHY